jgi:signal transduction histidine kinase
MPNVHDRGPRRWWGAAAACAALALTSLVASIHVDGKLRTELDAQRLGRLLDQWDHAVHALIEPSVAASASFAAAHRTSTLDALRNRRQAMDEHLLQLARGTAADDHWFVATADGELLAGSDPTAATWSASQRRALWTDGINAQDGERAIYRVSPSLPGRLIIATTLRLAHGAVAGMVVVAVPLTPLQAPSLGLPGDAPGALLLGDGGILLQHPAAGAAKASNASRELTWLSGLARPAPTVHAAASVDGQHRWAARRRDSLPGLVTAVNVKASDLAQTSMTSWWLALAGLVVVGGLVLIGQRHRALAAARLDSAQAQHTEVKRGYHQLLERIPQPLALCSAARSTARVNVAMATLLQCDHADMAEQAWDWQALVAETDWPDWCAALQRSHESGQAQWLRTALRAGQTQLAVMAQIVPVAGTHWQDSGAQFAVVLRTAAEPGTAESGYHLRELLHLAEMEKWQFGQAVHDELGQRLSGIAFMAKALEHKLKSAQRQEANDAAWLTQLAKESITVARGLARGLVPVGDDDSAALTAALTDLCQRLSTTFGAQCTLESDAAFNPGGRAQANHLYLAAQELMTNAFNHGHANVVVVRLEVHEGRQCLVVQNNGMPADLEAMQARRGMGLSGVRSRAAHLGGHFSLTNNAQGTGVTARIDLPLPAPGEPAPTTI